METPTADEIIEVDTIPDFAGSVEAGRMLAWSYYAGYLSYVTSDTYWNDVVRQDNDLARNQKLCIVLPEAKGDIFKMVEDKWEFDSKKMEPLVFDVAGTKGRAYNLTKHFLNNKYCMFEYPATLKTLTMVHDCKESGLSKDEVEFTVLNFNHTLKKIVSEVPGLSSKVKLIAYNNASWKDAL